MFFSSYSHHGNVHILIILYHCSLSLHYSFVLFFSYQLPELNQLMVEAAQILNIEPPDLYVRQSPVPNAYTLAIGGKKPFVVVHTSLVELLTRKELQVINSSVRIIFLIYYLITQLQIITSLPFQNGACY